MLIYRAYKFRLYPSEKQQALINKTIGCTRFIFNKCLNLKKNNSNLYKFDLEKEIPNLIQFEGTINYLREKYNNC